MKSYLIWAFLAIIVLSTTVKADCEDDQKEDDSWYKKLGCQIKKGAEDGYEAVKKASGDGIDALKPLGDKIATSTKEFGSTVAKKYDEVKHKLTDDEVAINKHADAPIANQPTEKVPLAPLPGQAEAKPVTGEQRTSTSKVVEPISFDDRFLLQNNECPQGQVLDHTKHCRTST